MEFPDLELSLPNEDDSANLRWQELPLGVLHIGAKIGSIEGAGFTTVGDLDDAARERLLRIPSVGRRTVSLLFQRRDALVAAADTHGQLNWEQYCEAAEIVLLPASARPESGREFLDSLPRVLTDVADHLEDETTAKILRERICRPPAHQLTLEEIARAARPPVTRERIRQKEKKLLHQLTGGILNDVYGTLEVHFHPTFTRWWRLAADRLAHHQELEVGEFLELLGDAWAVDPAIIMEHLPTIMAVVTGEPQMPAAFRSAINVDPCWYGPLSPSLSEISVHKIRIGKDASSLARFGLTNLGVVGEAIRDGTFSLISQTTAKRVVTHLNLMANCLTPDHELDWDLYRTALELRTIPAEPPASALAFAESLVETLTELLAVLAVTLRAPEIYRLRTSGPQDRRMTLHRVADELGTHQPTVKREETILLEYLHDVLIDREYNMLPIWLDEAWLAFWGEAEHVFRSADHDYDSLSDNLAWRWRLRSREISRAMPSIWAVLTGYPNGRPHQVERQPLGAGAGATLGTIRLKGFRRLH